MTIWTVPIDFAAVNGFAAGTMIAHLGIRFTAAGDDWLAATMPVDARTRQPYGLLHGGASVVLAETISSVAGGLTLRSARTYVVGMEINANHVRSIEDGFVTGTARPLSLGRSTQVWDIRITDNREQLICVSRATLAVRTRTT